MTATKKKQEALSRRASGPLSKPVSTCTVGALEAALLSEVPAADAEGWDRTGMTVGDPARLVEKVAVALDPTPEAVREAAARGANVLVTHHPAYLEAPEAFGPAPALPAQAGSVVWAAVESGVALMALHTALDVNPRAARVLPDLLNLSFKGQVLVPLPGSRRKGYGQVCAVRGEDGPLTLGQLSARCTSVFGRAPRVWGDFSRVLARVVTCTGAAGGVAREALRAQADCLVCGEVKYHDALALSQAGLCIVDVGHDTSELPLVAVLAELVEKAGIAPGRITVIDQRENWQYPESIRV